MIVSLTAYDRPEYLRETMAHLAVAASVLTEPTVVLAHIEPSDKLDEVLSCLKPYPYVYCRVNQERLGLQANTLAALTWAWSVAAVADGIEDFVLHLEDDLLISRDGLRLVAWMRDTYRDDPGVMSACLTNTGKAEDIGPEFWPLVHETSHFECHTWGTWRPDWEKMLAIWPHEWHDHWAARITYEGGMSGRHQMIPVLSRSRSIGIRGQHCRPENHVIHNPRVWAEEYEVPLDLDYAESPLT
jgi:hypothetical protein